MTDSQTARSPLPGAEPAPADDGTVQTITGFAGTVIATVARSVEFTEARDAVGVVAVLGDVDRDTAPMIEQTLLRAIDEHPHTWLDMRQAGFFGAAGVRTLVRAHEHAATLGHTVRLRGVHGITAHVLTVAGLHHLIPAVR